MRIREFIKRWRPSGGAAGPRPPYSALLKRVRVAHRLNEADWLTLVLESAEATADWERDQWLELDFHDRVAFYLAATGDRTGTELVGESRSVNGRTIQIDRASQKIEVGPDLGVPDWLLSAQPQDFVARATIEVAGSSPVVIAGTSFISGLPFDAAADSISLRVKDGLASTEVPVTMRPDPAAAADSGERWADQTQASWWARANIDRSGEVGLEITVVSADISRTVEFTLPARRERPPAVSVTRDDDGLVLEGELGRVEVANATECWADGEVPLALPTKVAKFASSTVIATGRYAVSAADDFNLDLANPDQLTLDLASRELNLGEVHVALRVAGQYSDMMYATNVHSSCKNWLFHMDRYL